MYDIITNMTRETVIVDSGKWMDPQPAGQNPFRIISNIFPLQLAPRESRIIQIQFEPLKEGEYSGLCEFYINSYARINDSLCYLSRMQVIGSTAETSVAAIPGTGPNISISPNPAYEQIIISTTGARSASFEIFNALGERIASRPQVTEWQWNPKDEHVSEGIYFVRCAGVSEAGKAFVETKKLIVRKK